MKKIIGLAFLMAALSACSKESGKEPGALFPAYPCMVCADGTAYCSDFHKGSC